MVLEAIEKRVAGDHRAGLDEDRKRPTDRGGPGIDHFQLRHFCAVHLQGQEAAPGDRRLDVAPEQPGLRLGWVRPRHARAAVDWLGRRDGADADRQQVDDPHGLVRCPGGTHDLLPRRRHDIAVRVPQLQQERYRVARRAHRRRHVLLNEGLRAVGHLGGRADEREGGLMDVLIVDLDVHLVGAFPEGCVLHLVPARADVLRGAEEVTPELVRVQVVVVQDRHRGANVVGQPLDGHID
mmetsp:Transcript_73462/g.224694  ORF Transcript_73462/g.224694 Transcript_73462/m.224694 type:complete len:238 (-) Transcript_73462:128-841(-)